MVVARGEPIWNPSSSFTWYPSGNSSWNPSKYIHMHQVFHRTDMYVPSSLNTVAQFPTKLICRPIARPRTAWACLWCLHCITDQAEKGVVVCIWDKDMAPWSGSASSSGRWNRHPRRARTKDMSIQRLNIDATDGKSLPPCPTVLWPPLEPDLNQLEPDQN